MDETSSAPPPAAGSDATAEQKAERKRAQTRARVQKHREEQRNPSASTVGSRPGRMPGSTKANPFAFGPGEGLGDPLGVPETKRNLVHAHLALARIFRSRIDLGELDDEFDSAAAAYSDIANHLLPWLRILPRIIAPLVLIGALTTIWAAMLLRTPWLQEWWARRQAERQAREQLARQEAAAAQGAAAQASPPPAPAGSGPMAAGPVVVWSTSDPSAPGTVAEVVEHPPIPVLSRGALSKR